MQNANTSDLEQNLIGSLLNKNDYLLRIDERLRGIMFSEPFYGEVFERIKKSYFAGKAEDPFTLKDLCNKSEVKNAFKILVESLSCSGVNVKEYSKEIISSYQKRLIKERIDSIDYSKSFSQISKHLEILEDFEISKFEPVKKYLDVFEKRVEEIFKDGEDKNTIKTGYFHFDRTFGGLVRGELAILAARPSMGKTVFALNLAYNIVKEGSKVGFLSLETGGDKLVERLVCMSSDLKMKGYYSQDEKVISKYINASKAIKKLPLYINDMSSTTADSLYLQAKKLVAKKQLDVLIIDHLAYMHVVGNNNLSYEIGKITKKMKAIAKELNVSVLLLSQLNRESVSAKSTIPQLQHLRQSGEIEQDADRVYFVHRPEYYIEREEDHDEGELNDWKDKMQIICSKNRDGPLGNILFGFNKETQRIENAIQPTKELEGNFTERFKRYKKKNESKGE